MWTVFSTSITFTFRTIEAIKVIRNWPRFLAGYISDTLVDLWPRSFNGVKRHHGQPIIFTLRNGTKLRARRGTRDWEAVLDVWSAECYNPSGFEIGEDNTVVDIGAHIGMFSIYAATKARSGRVIAFEPDPDNYTVLQRNLDENHIRNVLAFNQAVSDQKGTIELYLSNLSLGHSMYPNLVDGEVSGRLAVDATDLNSIFEENAVSKVDLLKMNCEGAEYGIIFNCPGECLQKIVRMSIQYHDIDDTRNGEKLAEFLKEKGFQVRHSESGFRILYATRRV